MSRDPAVRKRSEPAAFWILEDHWSETLTLARDAIVLRNEEHFPANPSTPEDQLEDQDWLQNTRLASLHAMTCTFFSYGPEKKIIPGKENSVCNKFMNKPQSRGQDEPLRLLHWGNRETCPFYLWRLNSSLKNIGFLIFGWLCSILKITFLLLKHDKINRKLHNMCRHYTTLKSDTFF